MPTEEWAAWDPEWVDKGVSSSPDDEVAPVNFSENLPKRVPGEAAAYWALQATAQSRNQVLEKLCAASPVSQKLHTARAWWEKESGKIFFLSVPPASSTD